MTTARRAGASSAATLFALATAIVLAHVVAPDWTKAAGLDLWEVPALRNQTANYAKHCSELNEEIEESRNRVAIKEHLIELLVSGEMSLKDVTDEFLELNRGHNNYMIMIRRTFNGSTDREKIARNVLAFTSQRERGSLFQRMAVMARLMNEFEELKNQKVFEIQ
jgi:hypothetical protein